MTPSMHQRLIMKAALESPTLRVPTSLARSAITKQHLTDGGARAYMRYVAQNLELELTRYGAQTLGAEELALFERKSAETPVPEDMDDFAPNGMGHWINQDAKTVFACAYQQSRLRGLSAAAARAILLNVVAAVAEELKEGS